MFFPEWVYTLDILFAVFVLLFVFGGVRHGLSGELARMAALLVFLTALLFFFPHWMQLAAQQWPALSQGVLQGAVVLALLLAAVLLCVLLQVLLKLLFKSRIGDVADKLAGSLAGLVRGTLIGLALMVGLSLLPSPTLYQTLSEKSAIGSWVCRVLTPWIYPRLLELPVFDRDEARRGKAATELLTTKYLARQRRNQKPTANHEYSLPRIARMETDQNIYPYKSAQSAVKNCPCFVS